MAKAKVKVGIYKKTRTYGYGYDKPDLITEEQFEELVADRVEDLKNNENEFADYLADNYSYKEIFDMDEDDKAEVREEYESKCVDWARDGLENDWDYDEIETEVDISTVVCPCPCSKRK